LNIGGIGYWIQSVGIDDFVAEEDYVKEGTSYDEPSILFVIFKDTVVSTVS
jgi:hypothetical protein